MTLITILLEAQRSLQFTGLAIDVRLADFDQYIK